VASVSFLPEFSSSLAQWQSRGFLASVSDEFICESIRFLKERGLLSERMDGVGRSWYRLHPLLADAMSSGWLVQGGSWERSLYRRASTWYLCEGMLEEAVQLASGARDWDAIRDIILENWRKKFEEDELSCLLNWLSLLPEDYVKRYPKLCLFAILPLGVGGDFERARKWFTRAKKLSKVEGDRYSASADALYSLVLSMEGKLDKSYELAQRAIEWLPDEDADLKAMVSQTLGSSLSPPDIVGAYEMIKEAEMTQKTGTDRNVRCSLFANLALIEAQLGLDSAAIKHIRLAREMSSHQADRVSPMLAFAQLAEGITAYHKGNLSAARNLLSEAIELFRFNYVPRHIAFAKALLSAILIQTGRRGEAMELIEQACLLEQMSIADTFPGLIPLSGWLASDAFNDFNAQQMFGGCAAGGIAHRWLMLSCAFVEGAKLGFAQIDNLEHAIDPTRFPLAFINTLLLKGAVAERAGRAELSVQALSRAVDMAAREHTIQPFFDAHSSIKKSLKTLARTQPEGFAAVIFRQLPKHAETISGAAIDVSVQQKLSSRELDVMRIIDTGLSIHQTAERLFISPETVKKHLVHIYAKLKVHSRYEALTVLRKQGLL
jgi:LuxR family maltose regulon positive regulatory protein